MLTTEDGRFFYYGEDGSISTGVFTVSGNTFSGPEYKASFKSGACIETGLCGAMPEGEDSGTVNQGMTLILNGTTWSYNTLYNYPSSLSAIAGTWYSALDIDSGASYTVTPGILSIAPNGTIFQHDAASTCEIDGQVSLINTSYNAYAISLTYTGSGCWSNGGTGQGIAYIDYAVSPISLDMAIDLQQAGGSQITAILASDADQYQSPGGVWTAAPQAGVTAFMLSDEQGTFFYRTVTSACTELYQGSLSTTTNNQISGSGLFQPVPGQTACGGAGRDSNVSFTGTLNPSTSMMLSNNVGGAGNPIPTIDWSYNGSLYDQPSSLASVAGNWISPAGDTIVVDAGGNISESDAGSGCAVTGTLSIIDPTYNVYNLAMTYANCTSVPADLSTYLSDGAAGLNSAAITGLATVDSSVTPRQLDLWFLLQYAGAGSDLAYVVGTSH